MTEQDDYGPCLSDEEWANAMCKMLVIQSLRDQLKSAHEYIDRLRKELKDQTAAKVAEVAFGYNEPRPPRHTWVEDARLPSVDISRFKKTNTEVLEISTLVIDELKHSGDIGQIENMVKSKMMSDLFFEMQKAGLFRSFQRKVAHETIYTIAIEVAKP